MWPKMDHQPNSLHAKAIMATREWPFYMAQRAQPSINTDSPWRLVIVRYATTLLFGPFHYLILKCLVKQIAQAPTPLASIPVPLSTIRVPSPTPPSSAMDMAPFSQHTPAESDIESLEDQIRQLRELIAQSENNLKAHYESMENMKKVCIQANALSDF